MAANKRILLVNDEPNLTMIGRVMYSRLGYDAVEATSIADAQRLIHDAANASTPFGLIITDVSFGADNKDGFELVRFLKQDENGRYKHVPTVLTTGDALANDEFMGVPIINTQELAKISRPDSTLRKYTEQAFEASAAHIAREDRVKTLEQLAPDERLWLDGSFKARQTEHYATGKPLNETRIEDDGAHVRRLRENAGMVTLKQPGRE